MAEQTTEALQHHIAALEQQLAAQRAERGADAAAPYERQEVHSAVGEQIKQTIPSYQPQKSVGGAVPSWQDPALAGTIQKLVDVTFTQNIQAAITQAMQSGNPAIIDAFHDVLTDFLHKELLNRQKITPAP